MSDEFESSPSNYSPFIPLLILLVGLSLWAIYQDYAANSQRSLYHQQFQQAIPTISAAKNVSDKYVALMKDLVDTSAKDPYAADIVKAAIQAGLIHVNQNATNGATASAPAPADAAK